MLSGPVHHYFSCWFVVEPSGNFTSYTALSILEKSMVMTRLGGTYCLRETMGQKEEERDEERERKEREVKEL